MNPNAIFTSEEAAVIASLTEIPFSSPYTAFQVSPDTDENGTKFWVKGKLGKRWWAINYLGKDFAFTTKEDAHMVKRALTKLLKNPIFG
jgi:hypothetical protein